MYNDVIATSDDGRLRVILEVDQDCERPMDQGDWWTTSVLVLRHRTSYDREAEYDPEDRLSIWRDFNGYRQVPDADEAFIRYMRIFHDVEVIETGFGSDRTNALAWIEPSERERVGIPDTYPAEDAIETEITEHNRWADGECYGYIVQKLVSWSTDDEEYDDRDEWEDTDDSCWGYIGREYAEEQATEALAGHR